MKAVNITNAFDLYRTLEEADRSLQSFGRLYNMNVDKYRREICSLKHQLETLNTTGNVKITIKKCKDSNLNNN